MANWQAVVEPLPHGARLLVSEEGNDVLLAHLANYPEDPRALMVLLEGLARWQGAVLCVAISADVPCSHSLGLGPFTDGLGRWPEPSALLHYRFVSTGRKRRLRGLGDFSSLRRVGASQ